MKIEERKQAFVRLGQCLSRFVNNDENGVDEFAGKGTFCAISQAVQQAYTDNNWFTAPNVYMALTAIANDMLTANLLNNWLVRYPQIPNQPNSNKSIGIIMAGNIPLVGFHDMLCVLVCGYCAVIKPSSKDTVLIKTLADVLCCIEPRFAPFIRFTQQRPENVDAIISTGSNNSARYFESWYSNIPHIIRKNRNSVAILTGNETQNELELLGKDIFSYFGLGCRNVSSLFVPEDYNFEPLLQTLQVYSPIFKHQGYNNCYRYQKAIMDINKTPYLDNGFLLLKNSVSLSAPIALVNYQKYITLDFAKNEIDLLQDKIQYVVYQGNDMNNCIKAGQTQHPQLYDYADGIDTIAFLTE